MKIFQDYIFKTISRRQAGIQKVRGQAVLVNYCAVNILKYKYKFRFDLQIN